MTDAKYCDLHASQEGSLIRIGRDGFYQGQFTHVMKELNPKTGKQNQWMTDTQRLAICHTDFLELIAKRAKGLGVDLDWSARYKLGQVNGKFSRIIHPDDAGQEETEEIVSGSDGQVQQQTVKR